MTRHLPVLLLMTLLPLAGAEEAVSLETTATEGPSILLKSPFLPPDFQPPGSPGKAAPKRKEKGQYEFRGVYELGGVYHYNLYNSKDQKGYWVTEADAKEKGFDIVEFKPGEDALVLMVDGEKTDLALVETSDMPMQIQGAKPRTLDKRKAATGKRNSQTARRRVIRPTNRSSTQSKGTAQRRTVNRSNP